MDFGPAGELFRLRQHPASGVAANNGQGVNRTMDDTENGQDESAEQPEPGWAKAIRKENAELKRQLEAREQEIAARDRTALFDKVGIPAEKAGALFRKSYDGALDEAAIKAAALEYGLVQEERTTPVEEAEVLNRINDSLAGAQGPSDLLSADVDAAVTAAIEKAESPEEVERILKRHKLYVYDA